MANSATVKPSFAELALFSFNPATHPPTHPDKYKFNSKKPYLAHYIVAMGPNKFLYHQPNIVERFNQNIPKLKL